MSLSSTLPVAIRETHDRIERLPISLVMAQGTVPRPRYCRLLAQLRRLHLAFEALLADEPTLSVLYHPSMARAGDLLADLRALGGADDDELTPPAAAFVEKLRSEWAGRPAALAGCLYVLEGSRMGSMFLARPLAKALGVPPLPGRGLDYHVRDMDRRPMLFNQFKAALDALPFGDAEADEVRSAAVETMEALHAIYAWIGEPAEALAGSPA
jgi:heme oxygenase